MFALNDLSNDNHPSCPVVRQDQLGFWLGERGWAATSNGYVIEAYKHQDVAIVASCGPDLETVIQSPDPAAPFGVVVEAAILLENVPFQALLDAQLPGQMTPVQSPNTDLRGWDAVYCVSQARDLCFVAWSRGGLAVSIIIAGPAGQLNEQNSTQLLHDLVPDAINNLGTYRPGQ